MVTVAKDGATGLSGASGASIVWQGSLSEAPASPSLNWAYYDSTDHAAYIYNGADWELMSSDGKGGLNVSGTVAPGSYLSLAHGLGRGDLTYCAQFVKDGVVRDYGEYEKVFGLSATVNDVAFFESQALRDLSTAVLANGATVVVYHLGETGVGKLKIYAADGSLVRNYVSFHSNCDNTDVAALSNGNFVIVYNDEADSGCPYFIIYSATGASIVAGPVKIHDYDCSLFSQVIALSGGGFVVLCPIQGDWDMCARVYGADGSKASVAEQVYVNANQSACLSPLDSGGFLVARQSDGSGI